MCYGCDYPTVFASLFIIRSYDIAIPIITTTGIGCFSLFKKSLWSEKGKITPASPLLETIDPARLVWFLSQPWYLLHFSVRGTPMAFIERAAFNVGEIFETAKAHIGSVIHASVVSNEGHRGGGAARNMAISSLTRLVIQIWDLSLIGSYRIRALSPTLEFNPVVGKAGYASVPSCTCRDMECNTLVWRRNDKHGNFQWFSSYATINLLLYQSLIDHESRISGVDLLPTTFRPCFSQIGVSPPSQIY